MSLNEDILAEDPESQAVEADEEVIYEPESESNVVAIEPLIITVGRSERKKFLKNEVPNLRDESSNG